MNQSLPAVFASGCAYLALLFGAPAFGAWAFDRLRDRLQS